MTIAVSASFPTARRRDGVAFLQPPPYGGYALRSCLLTFIGPPSSTFLFHALRMVCKRPSQMDIPPVETSLFATRRRGLERPRPVVRPSNLPTVECSASTLPKRWLCTRRPKHAPMPTNSTASILVLQGARTE